MHSYKTIKSEILVKIIFYDYSSPLMEEVRWRVNGIYPLPQSLPPREGSLRFIVFLKLMKLYKLKGYN